MHPHRKIVALVALALACLPAASGCKKGLKLVPATGVVMYKGKPLPGAYVNFQYSDSSSEFLAMGTADENGRFRMKTLSRDGVVPGRHRVWISKFLARELPKSTRKTPKGEAAPEGPITQFTMEEMYKELAKKLNEIKGRSIEDFKARAKAMQMPLAPSVIPVKYADPDTSNLEVEVYEDQENDFTFIILDPEEDPEEKAKLKGDDGKGDDEKSKTLLLDSAAGL